MSAERYSIMTKMVITLLVLCVLLHSHSVLSATKCYKCSTSTNQDCANPIDKVTDYCTSTSGAEINCLSYTYSLNDRNITYRGCRTLGDNCDDVKNAVFTENKVLLGCTLCPQDLCINASSPLKLPTALTIASFIVIKYFN
jgi:hypothetical protein